MGTALSNVGKLWAALFPETKNLSVANNHPTNQIFAPYDSLRTDFGNPHACRMCLA